MSVSSPISDTMDTPPILALPPELLGRVFAFLADERRHISASRLVCRTFKELSSPYLITAVVFAKRWREVTRLHEVLNHPYFSRHVTELIYDSSLYNGAIATNWNAYVDACEDAPRMLRDAEWMQRKRDEAIMWHDIGAYSDLPAPPVPPVEEIARLSISDRASGSADDVRGSPGLPDNEHDRDDSENGEDGEDSDDGMDDYYDTVYRLGCHKSFPDYMQRYRAQRRMEAASVPKKMLRSALSGFPRLRTITYSDYRMLSRNGESFDQCCRRNFGNTLQPSLFPGKSDQCQFDVVIVLNAIAESKDARIDSLCFTGSRLQANPADCYCTYEEHDPRRPSTIPLRLFRSRTST